MLQHAFKEWAVICKALAEGYQTIILRKGGIEEIGEGFRVEHERFWLFPTYTHQQTAGVVSAAMPMLKQVEKQRPPEGIVRLSHFAEIADVFRVTEVNRLLSLGGMHFWSEETVRAKFQYRRPELFVLTVRVFQSPEVFEIPNTPVYDGCRSWVELDSPLATEGAMPVISAGNFEEACRTVRQTLGNAL